MNKNDTLIRMDFDAATDLAKQALKACGASDDQASALARAAVDADAHGHHGQGVDHLDPYCDGLLQGRINGHAEPVIESLTPIIIHADAGAGTAHLAFERASEALIEAAAQFGLAAYSCSNSFPCGELGYFVRRLMAHDLGGMAATNAGPALLAAAGAKKAVFCTNPFAFGLPCAERPLLIDQSSSSTAFTNLRIAARDPDATIPQGWALDAAGEPTTDPKKAIEGVLLAYGGNRGANMAMVVEMLAAGLSGANWSVDAPPFHKGGACPGGGMFVLAFDPTRFGDLDAPKRMSVYLDRLEGEFGAYLPGKRKFEEKAVADQKGVALPSSSIANLQRYIDR